MSNTKKLLTTRNMCLCGMFAALMAVISQIQVPMPGGVPITIQVFGIALIGAVLGWKLGLLTVIVYILIGVAGLPVFAGLNGGPQALVGMSGGYILGWPIMAVLCGLPLAGIVSNKKLRFLLSILLSLAGLLYVEAVGGLQWAKLSESMDFGAVMAYSFVAFIPKDCVITVLGMIIGRRIHAMMKKAGFVD